MEFLDGPAAHERARGLLSTTDEGRLAVAYWGRGSIQALRLDRSRAKFFIVCDLLSGVCNPDVMLRMLSMPQIQLRTHNQLHAKMYLTGTGLIVGSSNASANGLGYEGAETSSLREANVFSADRHLIQYADTWFNRLWNEARDVTEPMIFDAKRLWRDRRSRRQRQDENLSAQTLLSRLRNDPEWFRDRALFVNVWRPSDISEEAKSVFQRKAAHTYTKKEQDLGPYYEEWIEDEGKPGDTYLDWEIGPRGKVSYQGLWQIPRDMRHRFLLKTHSEGRQHVLVLVRQLERFQDLEFPDEERREFNKLVSAVLRKEKWRGEKDPFCWHEPICTFWQRLN